MAELQVAYPDLTDQVFTDADKGQSGSLDADEIAVAMKSGIISAQE